MTVPPDDQAYDSSWIKLLALLEDRGVPALYPGALIHLANILDRVRNIETQGGLRDEELDIVQVYRMSLEAILLIQVKQSELSVTELRGRLEAAGLSPLNSNQLDSP